MTKESLESGYLKIIDHFRKAKRETIALDVEQLLELAQKDGNYEKRLKKAIENYRKLSKESVACSIEDLMGWAFVDETKEG